MVSNNFKLYKSKSTTMHDIVSLPLCSEKYEANPQNG